MGFPYYLLLFTLVGYPIIALSIVQFFPPASLIRYLKYLLPIIGLYNIWRLTGWSFRGDYFDYPVFSLQYFVFSVLVCLAARDKVQLPRVVRLFSLISFVLGFVIGLSGIFFFMVISKELEADRQFRFISGDQEYATRRYSSGYATFSNTKYIFKSYQRSKLSLFEKKVDETIFYDDETELKIRDDNLTIKIIDNQLPRKIIFKSTNGKSFEKLLN